MANSSGDYPLNVALVTKKNKAFLGDVPLFVEH
jgi:hypothetical protein